MRRLWFVVRARWLGNRGDFERLAGRYDRAERLVREALALAERVTEPDDILRATLLNSLGVIYKYQGRFVEAAAAYRRGFRVARRLGLDHPVVATFYHNLGGLEHARGRYARGEPFARRAAAIRQRALGPDHPDVARDLAALAGILDGLQRHAEAEELHRQALANFERRFGPEHRDIAYALDNLAACCHARGRTTEAEPFALRALAMKKKLLGASHPDVGLTLANLAVIQKAQGRLLEADACCRQALAIFEEKLGSAHPATVACRINYMNLRVPLPQSSSLEKAQIAHQEPLS